MRVLGTKQLLLETENNKVSIFGNTASLCNIISLVFKK